MKIIAGNWKMNGTPSENIKRLEEIKKTVTVKDDTVIVFPPSISLCHAGEILADTGIEVGAQNIYALENGAYTGELSVAMLRDIGVKYCLVGHSERRQYLAESNAFLGAKAKALLDGGLIPVFCIGETLEQREKNQVKSILECQIREGLSGIAQSIDKDNFVIGYEPVWAIGTGKTATSEEANETMGMIRELLADMDLPIDIHMLYGGSAKPNNAKELLSEKNINGLLIGGAALDPQSFCAMVNWRES